MAISKKLEILEAHPEYYEKLEQMEKIQIQTPAFLQTLAYMEECLVLSQRQVEPSCMMLTGETGTGKSTVMKEFERHYPKIEHDTFVEVPILRASVPLPVTISNMMTNLLASLRDPAADRGTQAQKATRLNKLLIGCKVRLIILDEFQHLIEGKSQHNNSNVSDWLKTLINETRIPVVLCGMPTAKDVLSCNPQLMRRFQYYVQFKPFSWVSDQHTFQNMLLKIDKELPFKASAGLANGDMPLRLMVASGGSISRLMKYIRGAAALALLSQKRCVQMEDFAEHYETHSMEVGINPFTAGKRELERMANPQKEEVA